MSSKKKKKTEQTKLSMIADRQNMIILILLLIAVFLTVFLYFNNDIKIFFLNQIEQEQVIIDKKYIIDCCSYEVNGENKVCHAISPYDCSFCNDICSKNKE